MPNEKYLETIKKFTILKENKSEVRKMCEFMEELQDKRKKEILIRNIRN